MLLRTLPLALAALMMAPALAQEYPISAGNATTCQGAFLDSGGNPGPYGNNENFTSTICPDGGPAISLQWIVFDLSTAGVAPIDQISIYDGSSTAAPLIGTYTGTNSPGIVSASFANPTGCLTVVFTSNNTGTGNFAANITCFQPCEPPTAVASITGEVIPALVCQNEELTFNASASFAAAGFNVVNYLWDFADGSLDSTSGAVSTHAFDVPGEYVVQVTVTDDNGCTNTNVVDLQVLVSTTPIFSGTTPSTTICQGESVDLVSSPTPVLWSALPESNLGAGIALPDLQGVAFNTSLTFTNFSPGQVLTNPNDLESLCVSMEHSFMGDLVISLTCPNGQNIVFHQQGGGGTYIGGANDTDNSQNPILGECWDYCWSPTATLGTWANSAAFGTSPNVMIGGNPPSNALIPGTYSSVQPWSNLQGCPLNGEWTFTINDLWAADNGFLCSWSMNFNPSLFPSLTQFTPVLGVNSPDSVSWTGEGFVADPNNPAAGVATPTEPGVYDYIFSVTDNFGCTYDTTITVTVNPTPQAPILVSGDATFCEGGLAFLNAPPGYDAYVWSNGATGPNISVNQPGSYFVTVSFGDCSTPSEPFDVVEAPIPIPVITGPQFSCGGLAVELTTTEPFATYEWSNGVTDGTILAGTGTYTVTVTTAQGCTATSDPYEVLVGNDPTAAFTTDPTSPQNPGTTVSFNDQSDGNGSQIVDWDWTFGTMGDGSSAQNPGYTYNDPGTYFITLIVTTAEGCSDTTVQAYVIRPEEIFIPNVFSPNGDGINDFFVVENLQYYGNTTQIYNRWGQVMYEANNYRNNWRGTDLPDGTYYYVITLTESGEVFTGHVTLLR